MSRDSCFTLDSKDVCPTEAGQDRLNKDPDAWIPTIQHLLSHRHPEIRYICLYIQRVEDRLRLQGYCFLEKNMRRALSTFNSFLKAEHEKPDNATRSFFATCSDRAFEQTSGFIKGPFRTGCPPSAGRRSDLGARLKTYSDIPQSTKHSLRPRACINVVIPNKDISRGSIVDLIEEMSMVSTDKVFILLNKDSWTQYQGETVVICVNPESTSILWQDFADGLITHVPCDKKRLPNCIKTVWILLTTSDTLKCYLPITFDTYDAVKNEQNGGLPSWELVQRPKSG
jgi:hypothetical protein